MYEWMDEWITTSTHTLLKFRILRVKTFFKYPDIKKKEVVYRITESKCPLHKISTRRWKFYSVLKEKYCAQEF